MKTLPKINFLIPGYKMAIECLNAGKYGQMNKTIYIREKVELGLAPK